MPINAAASQMFTLPTMAREMPTASASMEVATAMRNMVLTDRSASFSGSSPDSSFFSSASFSMLMPMMTSRPKATQWSNASMASANSEPRKKPVTGISIWKPPNQSPQVASAFSVAFFMARPLHTDTAKASILSPTASKNSSPIPIKNPPYRIHVSTEDAKRLCRPAKVSSFQAEPGPHQYVDSVPRCAPTTPSSRRIITKIPPLVKAKRRNTQLFYKWLIAHSTTSTAALLLKATTIRLLPR